MAPVSLRSFWHPIATADEVVEQPRQFRLFGEDIVAFRDAAGAVAFKDLCIHRGAALSKGRIENGRLICPYHAWNYDRTGACVGIPALPPGASIPAKARAITYRTQEAYGAVWVAMEEPAREFPAWPNDAWSDPRFRVLFVGKYRWKASAGRVIENAMDLAHFNFVHKGYTELADGPVIKPYAVTRTEAGLDYAYEDGRLRREYSLHFPFALHDRKLVINPGSGGTWSEAADSRAGDMTILSFIAAPVDDTTTDIYVYTARNHSLDREDKGYVAGFDVIMEQDRVVVESQRPELIPVDIRDELHLKFPDAAAVAYRRMLGEVRLS